MKKLLFFLLLCPLFLTSQSTDTAKVVTLEELQARFNNDTGHLTVYNFWATWCRPCVAELPNFEKLQEYAGDDIEVVLVSIDAKSSREKTLLPFIRKNNLHCEVLVLDGKPTQYIDKISPDWGGSIPATLIVWPEKNIYLFKEQEFTFEELKSIIDKLL